MPRTFEALKSPSFGGGSDNRGLDMPDQSAVIIQFQPQLKDYLHAFRHREQRSPARIVDKGFAVLLIGLGTWAMYNVGLRWWTVLPFVLAIVSWLNLLSPRHLIMRLAFRGNPKFRETYDVSFDENGARFHTRTSDTHLAWSHFQRAVETDQVFLLFYARRLYTVIPKSAFTARDRSRFRELLRDRMAQAAELLPVDPASIAAAD